MANSIFDTLQQIANKTMVKASKAPEKPSNPNAGPERVYGPAQAKTPSQSVGTRRGFVPVSPTQWNFINEKGQIAENVNAPNNPYNRIFVGPGQGIRGRDFGRLNDTELADAYTYGQIMKSPVRSFSSDTYYDKMTGRTLPIGYEPQSFGGDFAKNGMDSLVRFVQGTSPVADEQGNWGPQWWNMLGLSGGGAGKAVKIGKAAKGAEKVSKTDKASKKAKDSKNAAKRKD